MPEHGPDPVHERVLALESELEELREKEKKHQVSSEEARTLGHKFRELQAELDKLREIDLPLSGRFKMPTLSEPSLPKLPSSARDPVARLNKLKALETELTELRAREQGKKIASDEARETARKAKDLERQIALLNEAEPESDEDLEAPKSLPASLVDPGHGAPPLRTLLFGLIIGGIIVASLYARCARVGPHGPYKPTVQHGSNPIQHKAALPPPDAAVP